MSTAIELSGPKPQMVAHDIKIGGKIVGSVHSYTYRAYAGEAEKTRWFATVVIANLVKNREGMTVCGHGDTPEQAVAAITQRFEEAVAAMQQALAAWKEAQS